MELAVDRRAKRQVGPRRRRGALTRGVGTTLRRVAANPTGVAGEANESPSGQAARTARARARNACCGRTPATNDPRGRRLNLFGATKGAHTYVQGHLYTTRREARKPQGRRDHGLGVVGRGKRRSGMVRAGGTPGRHGAAGIRRRDAIGTARETPRVDLSGAKAPGGESTRAGDRGRPPARPRLETGRASAAGTAPTWTP
jgi:hypothetical protein